MSARNIIIACILIVIIIGIGSYVWYRDHTEKIFFSHALTSAGVTIPSNASLGSLELLYAQTMAERSPLFGIVGTDPADLASAVSALATTTQAIETAQTDPQNAKLAQSLYPIDFLRSLATTEAARQAFVADGTAQNEQVYDSALHATASAGITDSEAFDAALQTEIGTSTMVLVVPGHPITSSRMLQNASDIVQGMKKQTTELGARDACISGATTSCDPNDIVLPQVTAAALPPSSEPLPQFSSNVIATLSAALPSGFFSGSQITRLDSSECLGVFSAPYYVAVHTTNVDPRTRYLYIGNIIFVKPVAAFSSEATFIQAYGITYLYDDPLEFYQCPEVEADMSEASAVANTANFAKEHPELAPDDASELENKIADEGYARKYVEDALSDTSASSTEQGSLISLALEFNEGNAALATLVDEIATLSQFNLQAANNGSLLGGSDVYQLFITHSAFPSLFLVSSNDTVTSLRDTTISEFPNYLFYSTLRETVSENEIVRNLKASFDFDIGITP